MAKAHEPIKLTFLREGELSIDNSDTGGFTYLGIAYNKNKSFTVINEILEFVGNELIKLGIIKSIDELRNLGTPKGKPISISSTVLNILNNLLRKNKYENKLIEYYKKQYWDVNKCDDISSQTLAEELFDFGVNAGPGTAAKILQRLVDVKDDGNLGEMSLYAINCAICFDLFSLQLNFALEKIKHYHRISKAPGSENRKYIHGWLNRTYEIFDGFYEMDDLKRIVQKTSSDGKTGPKNMRGLKLYLEEDYNNLLRFIKIYDANIAYKTNKNMNALINALE
jgi:hypothetical protein